MTYRKCKIYIEAYFKIHPDSFESLLHPFNFFPLRIVWESFYSNFFGHLLLDALIN